MSTISGQLLISGQFQDIRDISGISGQLGALIMLKWSRWAMCCKVVLENYLALSRQKLLIYACSFFNCLYLKLLLAVKVSS